MQERIIARAQHRGGLDAETCNDVCDRADDIASHFNAPACLARKKREPYKKVDWSSQLSSANHIEVSELRQLLCPTTQLYPKNCGMAWIFLIHDPIETSSSGRFTYFQIFFKVKKKTLEVVVFQKMIG